MAFLLRLPRVRSYSRFMHFSCRAGKLLVLRILSQTSRSRDMGPSTPKGTLQVCRLYFLHRCPRGRRKAEIARGRQYYEHKPRITSEQKSPSFSSPSNNRKRAKRQKTKYAFCSPFWPEAGKMKLACAGFNSNDPQFPPRSPLPEARGGESDN